MDISNEVRVTYRFLSEAIIASKRLFSFIGVSHYRRSKSEIYKHHVFLCKIRDIT